MAVSMLSVNNQHQRTLTTKNLLLHSCFWDQSHLAFRYDLSIILPHDVVSPAGLPSPGDLSSNTDVTAIYAHVQETEVTDDEQAASPVIVVRQ